MSPPKKYQKQPVCAVRLTDALLFFLSQIDPNSHSAVIIWYLLASGLLKRQIAIIQIDNAYGTYQYSTSYIIVRVCKYELYESYFLYCSL